MNKFESTATMLEICEARYENSVRAIRKFIDEFIKQSTGIHFG